MLPRLLHRVEEVVPRRIVVVRVGRENLLAVETHRAQIVAGVFCGGAAERTVLVKDLTEQALHVRTSWVFLNFR